MGIIVLVGAAGFAALERGPSAGARTLALSFTPGERETYRIRMTLDGTLSGGELLDETPVSVDLTQVVTWEVVDVDEEGAGTIRATVTMAFGSLDGENVPIDASELRSIELRISPDGRILETQDLSLGTLLIEGSGAIEGLMGSPFFLGPEQLVPLLADHPVAPGDGWETRSSRPLPFGRGSIPYQAASRFLRYERVDGLRVALIRTELTERIDIAVPLDELLASMAGMAGPPEGSALAGFIATCEGELSLTQRAWVDPRNGDLLRVSSTSPFDLTTSVGGLLIGADVVSNGTFRGESVMEIEQVS
ncbi:MAG: hypothetical protein KatS3mg014_0164 [Actinomycetota bacterium]|nr:MAG: hypothetical protein KatS3mg014_0164 [Actinomycetota bacterium]